MQELERRVHTVPLNPDDDVEMKAPPTRARNPFPNISARAVSPGRPPSTWPRFLARVGSHVNGGGGVVTTETSTLFDCDCNERFRRNAMPCTCTQRNANAMEEQRNHVQRVATSMRKQCGCSACCIE